MRRVLLTLIAVGAIAAAFAGTAAAAADAGVPPAPPSGLRSIAAARGFTYRSGEAWPMTNAEIPAMYLFASPSRALIVLKMFNPHAAFVEGTLIRTDPIQRRSMERSLTVKPGSILKAESWREFLMLTIPRTGIR
jgi:hypothetical protein